MSRFWCEGRKAEGKADDGCLDSRKGRVSIGRERVEATAWKMEKGRRMADTLDVDTPLWCIPAGHTQACWIQADWKKV